MDCRSGCGAGSDVVTEPRDAEATSTNTDELMGADQMKIFSQIVRTVINTAMLPVAVLKDAVTMGDDYPFGGKTATQKQV